MHLDSMDASGRCHGVSGSGETLACLGGAFDRGEPAGVGGRSGHALGAVGVSFSACDEG